MTDRLQDLSKRPRSERLRQGQPLKPLHAYALTRLALSEPRIIGSSRRARIRDTAIGALRAVTLFGAVLIPVLTPDDAKKNAASPSDGPQPITLMVSSQSAPTAGTPAEVNLDLDVVGGGAAEGGNRFQVVGLNPVYVRKEGVLVAGVAMPQDYWYRTELGVGDVFWALPDGQFFFEMMDFQGCLTPSGGCSMTLNFAFNSGSLSEREIGTLSFGPGGAVALPGEDNPAVDCRPGAPEVYAISRTSFTPTVCRFDGLKVSLRQPEPDFRAVAAAGKVALEVKWCKPAGTRECP